MDTIYDANVYVEYELKKSWHMRIIRMSTLTDNIFKFNKIPHAVGFIKSKIPKSSKGTRFRIRKIEIIQELGKSFYYDHEGKNN